MRNCLVTGGAGFIGSHIAGALLERGDSVRVFDNFSTGKRENLAGLARENHGGRLELLEADMRDPAQVKDAMSGIEVVFHEAAFVSVLESMEKPQDCFDVNVTGTCTLLEAARQAGVCRVVIASSAAVYGDSTALPLKEQEAPRPMSAYAVSKCADEMYGALYSRSFGLEVCSLRYFNVYGPRQRPDSMYAAAVPIFIRRLLDKKAVTIFGDGKQTRDLIYVGDVVRANLIAAEHPAAAGQVLNICTGQATGILELLDVLRRIFPRVAAPAFAGRRAGDIYASVGSAAKAEEIIGFRASTALEEGLRATVQWMQ